jgi:hypothetical protein
MGYSAFGYISIPGGTNVQETRSGISRYAYFGGGYGIENHCYGARRRLCNYGKRRSSSTADPVPQWRRAGTADAVSKRRSTGTTDTLLIAAQHPQQST